LRPFLDAFNEAVDRVPGLSDALQNGEAITGKLAEDLRNDYDLTRSGAGLRLIRDALLAEAGEGLIRPALSAPETQLGTLVSKEVSGVEQQLGTLVAESERIEDEAIAQCLGRLARLSNPALISRLVDQIRGANARINKIMYWLYQSEDAGANPERVLAAALSAAGYVGAEAELTLRNLLSNYRAAKTVGAFTEENLARLRLGKSALLSNAVKLDIDHIIPVAIARELGTKLANLHLTPASVNRIAQEVVTSRALEYAEELNKAGLLSLQGLETVRQVFIRGGAYR
jgi:hypothetical protein